MTTTNILINKDLVDKAADAGKAQNRTPSEQIEVWAKVGAIMESNPELTYQFVVESIMAKQEKEAGCLTTYRFD